MFDTIDFTLYEPHIDFAYTTLLMIWGGSLIGVTMLAIPYIFTHIKSRDEASALTTAILKREDILIRIVVISMLVVFLLKRELGYSYQYFEWGMYIGVLHFYIFGKILAKRLAKAQAKIGSFDEVAVDNKERKRFNLLHNLVRYFYFGQVIGVVTLLYLHAFGL